MNRPAQHHEFDFNAGLNARTDAARQKLLLVEDDPQLSSFLLLMGQSSGFEVSHTRDGRQALAMAAQIAPDVVLLDWSIEGISGIEVCRRLRADRSIGAMAIVMISGRGDEDDRIHGLTSGADDYLVKPFSSVELFARIKAILRRTSPQPATDTINYGDISIERETYKMARAGRALSLRPREFELLRYLITRPRRVVSQENLLRHVWGSDPRVKPMTIVKAVSRLRRALHVDGLADPIRTVRSHGYSLDLGQA